MEIVVVVVSWVGIQFGEGIDIVGFQRVASGVLQPSALIIPSVVDDNIALMQKRAANLVFVEVDHHGW